MNWSMLYGALPKWYAVVGLPDPKENVVLLQSGNSGGDMRLTSPIRRHGYGEPSWAICVVCAGGASARPTTCWPFTGPQFPYRLSKLWFSSCLLYTSPSPRDGLLSRMP